MKNYVESSIQVKENWTVIAKSRSRQSREASRKLDQKKMGSASVNRKRVLTPFSESYQLEDVL